MKVLWHSKRVLLIAICISILKVFIECVLDTYAIEARRRREDYIRSNLLAFPLIIWRNRVVIFADLVSNHPLVRPWIDTRQEVWAILLVLSFLVYFRQSTKQYVGHLMGEFGLEGLMEMFGWNVYSSHDEYIDESALPALEPIENLKKPKSRAKTPPNWLIYDPVFGMIPQEVADRWKVPVSSKRKEKRCSLPPIRSSATGIKIN